MYEAQSSVHVEWQKQQYEQTRLCGAQGCWSFMINKPLMRVTVGDSGLLLYLWYVFQALINSLVCWFWNVNGADEVNEMCDS